MDCQRLQPRRVAQQPLCHHTRLCHAPDAEEARFTCVVFVTYIFARLRRRVSGREGAGFTHGVVVGIEGFAAEVARGLCIFAYPPRGYARYERTASVRTRRSPCSLERSRPPRFSRLRLRLTSAKKNSPASFRSYASSVVSLPAVILYC